MDGDARARLFVALDLPPAARDALLAWRAPVVERLGRVLRPVPEPSLHVTLCFLGSLPLADADAVGAAVARCAAPVPDLALARGLWLPPRRPRVLTVELDDPAGALARLQAALSDALVAGGWFRPEARAYLPHVTVARVRAGEGASRGGGARAAREPLPAVPPLAFAGEALALYRSHLGGGPARYEALTRAPLR